MGNSGLETLDFHAAWVAALDVLELEVDRAEALLCARPADIPDLIPWTPPAGIGNLPYSLLDRAKKLHQRQLAASAVLAAAIVGNRRHAEFIEAIDSTRPDARPVFVDSAF